MSYFPRMMIICEIFCKRYAGPARNGDHQRCVIENSIGLVFFSLRNQWHQKTRLLVAIRNRCQVILCKEMCIKRLTCIIHDVSILPILRKLIVNILQKMYFANWITKQIFSSSCIRNNLMANIKFYSVPITNCYFPRGCFTEFVEIPFWWSPLALNFLGNDTVVCFSGVSFVSFIFVVLNPITSSFIVTVSTFSLGWSFIVNMYLQHELNLQVVPLCSMGH